MKLYVTKDPKNFGELIALDLNDVVYIESYERTIRFHTLDGEYYPLQPSLSTYETHISQMGFDRLDRTNLVNMNKIKRFDEKRELVFFEDDYTINSKYGTVSSSSKSKVKKLLRDNQ